MNQPTARPTTKFAVNDLVLIIHDSVIVATTVTGIEIRLPTDSVMDVVYEFGNLPGKPVWRVESQVYADVDELAAYATTQLENERRRRQ